MLFQSFHLQSIVLKPKVAIQKDKMDRKFAENLAKLQSWFPRVNLAQHIYPQPSIEVRVSAVYREGILFAREATKYFIGNTWGRLGSESGLMGTDGNQIDWRHL